MKILVTGASGYIGGSVARKLVEQGHNVLGLLRKEEHCAKIKELGIDPLVGSLDNEELLVETCKKVDGVVNAADSDNAFAVTTMLPALSGTGKFFIHTSGSSIVADRACGEASHKFYHEDVPYTPIPEKAGRVNLDRHILAAAFDAIRSVVICPCLIYGAGAGAKVDSYQIPKLIQISKKTGAGRYIGKGLNIWSNVHVDDLAELYCLAIKNATAGSFFFAENGEASMLSVALSISKIIGANGKVQSMTMAEAVKEFGATSAHYAFASNSRIRAEKARKLLDWKPNGRELLDDIENGSYAEHELVRS